MHANANRKRRMSGFEIYYISDNVDDTARALALAKKGASPDLGGIPSIGRLSKNVRATVLDLVLTENRFESVELARHISRVSARDVGVKVLGIKGAPFAVLKRTRMPAVLAEVGFISNAREERYLKNAFYRQQVAEALVSGILSYKRSVERAGLE